MNSKKLLPVGFYDLIFEEAYQNHNNINLALDNFFNSGFKLIKTPLVEFEESFSSDKISNYFCTPDLISGKNIIFRNDITLQISRLVASRLAQHKMPLKLCYVGDVLNAKSSDLYADRQQTQVGFEIIGCDDEFSDFEVINLLLSTLNKLKLKKLLIEIYLPNFLQIFLEQLQLDNSNDLKKAIVKKNISEIRKICPENHQIIASIALVNTDLQSIINKIPSAIKSDNIMLELSRAKKIEKFLKENYPEIEICFDLFGDSDNSYHHDIAFDVFCESFSYPIARGGKYKIDNNHDNINAIGATIYMNSLRKISDKK